jgi:hypothetical protein
MHYLSLQALFIEHCRILHQAGVRRHGRPPSCRLFGEILLLIGVNELVGPGDGYGPAMLASILGVRKHMVPRA